MDKSALLEMNRYILGKIVSFGNFYKLEDTNESSFSNWNARDVIAHLNTWFDFLNQKLESFKRDNSFEDLKKSEIEQYNIKNYEKNKKKDILEVMDESKKILGCFKNSLELFTEDELMSKEFPTGFDVVLWRYVSMDLITHPVNHILYQYLKKRNYREFIFEAKEFYKYCNDHSDDYDTIYYFKDLFESKEQEERSLMELSKEYNHEEIIKEILDINK